MTSLGEVFEKTQQQCVSLRRSGGHAGGHSVVCAFMQRTKTHPHSILQVPTTQLTKMSIDPKYVELTADVLEIFL